MRNATAKKLLRTIEKETVGLSYARTKHIYKVAKRSLIRKRKTNYAK